MYSFSRHFICLHARQSCRPSRGTLGGTAWQAWAATILPAVGDVVTLSRQSGHRSVCVTFTRGTGATGAPIPVFQMHCTMVLLASRTRTVSLVDVGGSSGLDHTDLCCMSWTLTRPGLTRQPSYKSHISDHISNHVSNHRNYISNHNHISNCHTAGDGSQDGSPRWSDVEPDTHNSAAVPKVGLVAILCVVLHEPPVLRSPGRRSGS